MEKSDIEKVKIDLLRDTLKDATDTVRALDRKIIFLVSYNAIFLLLISRLFFSFNEVKLLFSNPQIFYGLLTTLGLVWSFYFIKTMLIIAPKINFVNIFESEEDKKFSSQTLFITTGKKLSLDTLVSNYEKINSYLDITKILYKEIGKVTYIRDFKVRGIEKSIKATYILTISFLLLIFIFIMISL